MAFTPTRENLYYMGWGKQTVLGTSVTPTQFWRWLDGTDANPEAKMTEEREGDSSPHISLVMKTSQYWKITVKEKLRPITVGCALQALLGTGSDTYTAPTTSTTLAAAITAGATTFQSTASLGNSGTAAFQFTPGYSSSTYEVQIVNLASRSGTGPYTYTLNGGATFANAHNNGDTVASGASHVLTRQNAGFDYYTIEAAFMSGSGFTGKAFRIQDCVCTEVKITGQAGKAIELEHTWYGTLATIQSGLLSPTFEGVSVVGVAGGPMVFYQGNNWTLDGATTGQALGVTKFDYTLKNSTTPEDGQNELLNPSFFIPGNFDCKGNIEVHFQSYGQYLETYFGSSSAPATTTDSYLVGFGAFSTKLLGDGPTIAANALDSLLLNLPNLAYTAAPLGKPKLDGKVLRQQCSVTAVKSPTYANPITLTLANGQASQY